MFNLTFSSYSDVNAFAGIVGVEGLTNALKSPLLDTEARQMIVSAIKEANKTEFCIKSFNDGNNEWEIYVYVDPENIGNTIYHHTMGTPVKLSDVTEHHQTEASAMIDTITHYHDNRETLCNLVGVCL